MCACAGDSFGCTWAAPVAVSLALALCPSVAFAAAPQGAAIELASDGATDYRIVVGANASVSEKAGAAELAKYLAQISGASFPVVLDTSPQNPKEIIVGNNAHLAALKVPVDWKKLGPQGLRIKTKGETLILVGGPQGGTINAVYEFLEKFLGCRWYALDCTVIPSHKKLLIGQVDHTYVPPFTYRRHGWYSDRFPDWAAPNHVNVFIDHAVDLPNKDPRLSDAWRYPGNAAVHTLAANFCDVRKHFDAHPEYFSLIDGKRVKDKTQLCLANPDVFRVVVADAKALLAAASGPRRVGMSAADWENYCRCPDCAKLYERFGVAGTYIEFANRVTAELARDLPDVRVDTLVYRWQRGAPPRIQYHPNFTVIYCPIEACVYHALDECDYNVGREKFVRELSAWSKAAKHLTLFLYTDSAEYLTPYPVIRALSRNFKLARSLGADGVFIEGHTRFADSQLGGLTSYLIAKLLWNPECDVPALIEEFTNAYYGAAAPAVRQYVSAVNDERSYAATNANRMMPFPGFHAAMQNPEFLDLKEEALRSLSDLFDSAENAAAGQWERVRRVKVVRLPLQVKILDQLPGEDPLWKKTRDEFFAFLKWTDVNTIKVSSVEDYRAQVDKKVVAEKEEAALLPTGRTLVELPEMWLFRTDPGRKGEEEKWFAPSYTREGWKPISTFKFWDYALDTAPYEGDGWYALDVVIPPAPGKKVWLIFGAVDENYTLWINGERIADNLAVGTAMWDQPAPVEITGRYKPGESNQLVVRVNNTKAAGGIWKPSRILAQD
ncbi:MAG: DUF4838 domain-containing protein [Planctomycetota bacterium]